MREIVFRGFNTENQKWYYGLLGKISGKYYIECKHGTKQFVEKNSVGQFTGAFDVEGKKIFEEDIVEIKEDSFDNEKGVIVFSMGEWVIKTEPDVKNNFHMFNIYCLSTKVVGNIYKGEKKRVFDNIKN